MGPIFGGARLPHDLRLGTKLLTLVNSDPALDQTACRAAGLGRCYHLVLRASTHRLKEEVGEQQIVLVVDRKRVGSPGRLDRYRCTAGRSFDSKQAIEQIRGRTTTRTSTIVRCRQARSLSGFAPPGSWILTTESSLLARVIRVAPHKLLRTADSYPQRRHLPRESLIPSCVRRDR